MLLLSSFVRGAFESYEVASYIDLAIESYKVGLRLGVPEPSDVMKLYEV